MSSPKQDQDAAKERRKRERELNDMRSLLSTQAGRRFVWRLLEETKVFGSIWHPSAAIHHNSGKQDVGHFVMGEVLAAREDALIEMMKEAKDYKDV